MNVPNHEKKAFKDMTPEERSAIVEAWLNDGVDYYSALSGWSEKDNDSLYAGTAYRTRPRKLVIPWEHIKPEYKWAAMDEDGIVRVYSYKPKQCNYSWYAEPAIFASGLIEIDTTGIDWRESLTQRPE